MVQIWAQKRGRLFCVACVTFECKSACLPILVLSYDRLFIMIFSIILALKDERTTPPHKLCQYNLNEKKGHGENLKVRMYTPTDAHTYIRYVYA